MAKKKNKKSGQELFDEYYSNLFGARWSALKAALLKDANQIGYEHNLQKPYFLDKASLRAAKTLPLDDATSILDMCAAPGGKSLVLASTMSANANLVSNERSRERKMRLQRVLDEHLPQSIRERVSVTGFDASRWCTYQTDAFERILLDVPCSSERHVLTSEKHLAQWTSARIKNLCIAQWAILSSSYRVLKERGYMLYSTCALNPKENDDIIEKLLQKNANAKIIQLEENDKDCLCGGERTKYGIHVLPDAQNGAGPLYFCLIYKANMDEN